MKRSRATQHPAIRPSSIVDLPDHILIEILSRLPLKAIVNCRCVSKHFRTTISDPVFANLHLPISPTTLMLRRFYSSDRTLCLVESFEKSHFVVDNDDDVHIPSSTIAKLNMRFGASVPNSGFEVLSSCNGLICFYIPTSYHPYYICNPVVNESVIVPQIERFSFDQLGSGFGFSPKTSQYKILRFLYPEKSVELRGMIKLETEIITVGTNLWRKSEDAPFYLHLYSSGCFLSGALHWILHNSNNHFQSICCFDFGDEKFHQFPGPPKLVQVGEVTVDQMGIKLLGGCLSLFCHTNFHQLDIWVLKDYGLKKCWTKEFVIELPWPSNHYVQRYEPLLLLNNNCEILMIYAMSSLISYNTRDGSFRNVKITGFESSFKATFYVPSFISIKDIYNLIKNAVM